MAAIFGIFSGFWLSYAALLVGLTHGWWGVTPAATVHTVAAFLISWLVRSFPDRAAKRPACGAPAVSVR